MTENRRSWVQRAKELAEHRARDLSEIVPRVYLAGKVAANDWRHGLFPIRGVALQLDVSRRVIRPVGPPRCHGLEYAGPFFISEDHGCYHGEDHHGLVPGGCGTEAESYIAGWLTQKHGIGPGRGLIQRSCLAWLDSADIVFAWIDRADAFGTLVEIGYAAALGTPVFLALKGGVRRDEDGSLLTKTWPDLWFAQHTANQTICVDNVAEAWSDFQQWWVGDIEMQAHWAARQHARLNDPTQDWSR